MGEHIMKTLATNNEKINENLKEILDEKMKKMEETVEQIEQVEEYNKKNRKAANIVFIWKSNLD